MSKQLLYTAHSSISIWGIISGSRAAQTSMFEGESIALHAWFLCEVIYAPLSALVRTSIAVFLLRIATNKIHRGMIYGSIISVWTMSVVYFFLLLFQCRPMSYFYEQILGIPGSCISSHAVPRATIAHSVISAAMDFILALLPVTMLHHVQLNKRTKASISMLLGMGVLYVSSPSSFLGAHHFGLYVETVQELL